MLTIKVHIYDNITICIAPCRDHSSKTLRYGTPRVHPLTK